MIKLTPYLILTTFLLLNNIPSSTSSPPSNPSVDVNYWCKSTPHPKACLYYLSPHYNSHPAKRRADFYKLSVDVASALTLRARGHLERVAAQSRKQPRLRKAVADCWRLYDDTLFNLNRTLRASAGRPQDAQTWLSAALTNLETCVKGFRELGAPTEAVRPMLEYNVSSLVSNCLAINRPDNAMSTPTTYRKLLQIQVTANVVVAADGSGDFKSVQAAVNSVASLRMKGKEGRVVIYVKAGVYNEIVNVGSMVTDLSMVGDGIGKTVITGSRSVAAGYTTFSSPTFSVFGDGFIAKGITFRNTFGPGSQAVALLSGSDQSVFYQCSIEGYQDTLCVYTQRQFYRECDIYGTIDFIFGNAAAVIQNCSIYVRRPNHGEANVVTAQGRTDPNQNTGIVVQFCNVTAAPELHPLRLTVKSFLGRPWMRYSRTVFLSNYIDDIIDPAGWLPFSGNFALDTLFYVEYKNVGPGSKMKLRVKWPGYHVITRPSLVKAFSVARFITGRDWIPAAGVPFLSGI